MSESEKNTEQIENEESLNEPEQALWQNFKCFKCYVKVDDLKTYKTHLWEKHLKRLELMRINSSSVRKTRPKQSNGNAKKKRKVDSIKPAKTNSTADQSESEQSDQQESSAGSSDDETEELIAKIENLPPEDYKYFNLDDIDEKKTLERAMKRYQQNEDKAVAIQKSRIGWAKWRTVMWPCIIEKYAKTSSNGYRVFIRYYEPSNQKGNIFKMPLPNVKIFFHSSEHFEIKENSAINFNQKHEFFYCYTKALKDCINFLDEQEAKDDQNQFENSNGKKSSTNKKHIVNGSLYTLDEIKEMAEQEMSLELMKINEEREKNSNKLIDILLTPELEKYLISIFNEEIDCTRHKNYTTGDLNTRKKMKFSSPGPLVQDDQQKLAGLITNLCKTKYENKPDILVNYEYDVLYPEVLFYYFLSDIFIRVILKAVIWGLKKIHNISYSKADAMYKQGFKRTDEERIKQRCNQILNNLEHKTSTESSLNTSGINESMMKKMENESLMQKFEDSCIDEENNISKDD